MLLPSDSLLAREFSVFSGSGQNLRQFYQRGYVNAPRTRCHLCAREGIEHPAGNNQNNAFRIPHLYEFAVRSSRDAAYNNLTSKAWMPRIMDFQLLPDMGRMNGHSAACWKCSR